MTDHAALIRRSLYGGREDAFDWRVRQQGGALVDAIEADRFDNAAITLGLELEAYAVRETDAGLRLAPVPDAVFEGPAAKELGCHNVELNTDASPFDADGVEAQAAALESAFAATRERARESDRELVLDAMWAVPPADGTIAYLDDVETVGGSDGDAPGTGTGTGTGTGADEPVRVARNMRMDPRYGALDNEAVRRAGGRIDFSVPGADLSFRTILFESLATSIQPHVQVPDVDAFPRYHNLATRTLGPLLALSTNSPFLPADCYGDVDPDRLVDETHHELRIAAFEQSMNQSCRKVRVPRDLDATADVVDHVVADETFAPFLCEWLDDDAADDVAADDATTDGAAADVAATADATAGDTVDGVDPGSDTLLEDCWEFGYKRSTYWRWVRGVAGGDAVEGACGECSLRVEYRPLPTQPTVRDVVALQVLTAGLLHGLVVADHPLETLPLVAAERSFYAAVEDGLDADLAWVDADGERTSDSREIFDEVFAYARLGLDDRGVPDGVQERYLAPLEARLERRTTPSIWKKRRVREALDDDAGLAGALERMQREYLDRSRTHETFADWL